jgi:hypothetical protein
MYQIRDCDGNKVFEITFDDFQVAWDYLTENLSKEQIDQLLPFPVKIEKE